MRIKSLFLLLAVTISFSTLTLSAKTLSYQKVHNMPTSIEKDYYIWRYLSQSSTSKASARSIIREASSLNKKLRTAYKKKTGFDPPVIKQKSIIPASKHDWKRRTKAHKYFKEGLELLENRNPKLAARYFETARQHYTKRYDKDKSLFWLYMSTKNTKYIKSLLQSQQPNIYTFIAADTIKAAYPKTITSKISKSKTDGFDIKNPIHWAKVKQKMYNSSDIDNLADRYKSQECIGVYTYLKAKACKHTKNYFPMPYREVMRHMSPQRQALIYAIARQESRFVPASVSRSFALGMMQFMPFLIKDIAKKKGESVDLDMIFDPYKAIEYADFHLDYLNKYLYHPLFVAYAYNGGIGFVRRYLQDPHNFRRGPYEPYMSMEKMENDEVREYGKKVLSNYIIYLNKLGVPTRIFPLLKTLATPSQTDAFRK